MLVYQMANGSLYKKPGSFFESIFLLAQGASKDHRILVADLLSSFCRKRDHVFKGKGRFQDDETNIFGPEDWWLEDALMFFWDGLLLGANC